MTKTELIEAVRELNATATPDFLAQFPEEQLQQYVDQLLQLPSSQLTAATVGRSDAQVN